VYRKDPRRYLLGSKW